MDVDGNIQTSETKKGEQFVLLARICWEFPFEKHKHELCENPSEDTNIFIFFMDDHKYLGNNFLLPQ